MTLKEHENGNFTYDVYLPSLEKYTYYVHYVHSLSKNICGRLRHDTCYSKPESISTIRYYAARMSTNFNLKIQSDHFGNGRSLSIEGFYIEILVKELNGTFEFHSHFPDDSRQDTFTTRTYIIYMLEELKNHQLKNRCTIWGLTDICCK